MQHKLTGPFLLFGVALLLWSSAAGLSSLLASTTRGSGGGASGHPQASSPAEDSPRVKELRKKASADPKAIEPKLELADALHEEAVDKSDNNLLMEAVEAYQSILSMDKENPQALVGMADLCFAAGILDKALGYYERYMTLQPEDTHARTNYSLVLIQLNKLADAEKNLNEIIAKEPKLFQAQLALALAYKLEGKKEESAAKAEEAKRLAPSDDERARIDSFLKSMDEKSKAGLQGPAEDSDHDDSAELAPGDVSPAGQVAAFFQNHPIVGPKVKSISWPELNVAKVALENFPVEQMPPFAREKFIGGMKEKLKNLPDKVQVKLYDAATDRELLSVEVGGQR